MKKMTKDMAEAMLDKENILKILETRKKYLGDADDSKEKYKDVPAPETIADVAALFEKIKEVSPNAILHVSAMGCKFAQSFTMLATAPIDFEAEAKRMGVDLNKRVFNNVKARNKVTKPLGIVDKDKMVLPMINSLIISVCMENDYDVVNVTKHFYEMSKNFRKDTGAI